jgi:ribose 5-phosphate isomerase A
VTKNIEILKQEAATQAVALVEDKMIVGLGSGSTAAYAIDMLVQRVKKGLNIKAIATSEQSRLQAENGGIHMTSFADCQEIDITIDGADEVEKSSLNLIKGLGGALLKEKMVALVSKKLVIIVDESKLVTNLGEKSPLSVEIVPFAWETTQARISPFCSKVNLRRSPDHKPMVTDSGNYLLDCHLKDIKNANILCRDLKLITGVVETGLFIGLTSLVIVADQHGIKRMQNN